MAGPSASGRCWRRSALDRPPPLSVAAGAPLETPRARQPARAAAIRRDPPLPRALPSVPVVLAGADSFKATPLLPAP